MQKRDVYKFIRSLTTEEQEYQNFLAHFSKSLNGLPPRIKRLWRESEDKRIVFKQIQKDHYDHQARSRNEMRAYKIVIFNKKKKSNKQSNNQQPTLFD